MFKNNTPTTISTMPMIFSAVNTSLKMKKDAVKIKTYTIAVVRGIMYPRSYLAMRKVYITKLAPYNKRPKIA
jgi:hypothetical protein